MRRLFSVILTLTLVLAASPPLVTANTPPLADAGLDQTVAVHTTVYLDATGTADPDGDVATYTWTITTPNETTTTPRCRDCARTRFTPTQIGTYAVTVHTTDDDGATTTDTLYVHVTPGDPPTVHLRGPTTTTTGTAVTFRATATAGDAPLRHLRWTVDGRTTDTTTTSGRHARDTLRHRFTTAGTHTVTVAATDTHNQTAHATLTIDVARPTPDSTPEPNDTLDTPTIRGPRIVTGDAPLTATYTLTNTHRATWWLDGTPTTTATTPTLTLAAGHHDLTASTGDTTARFPDGTTDIIADPAPTFTTVNTTGRGGLHATVTATDAYDNLATLTITADNTTIYEKHAPDHDLFRTGGTHRLSIDRPLDTDPGTHTIRITATDTRGQTTTTQRTITVAGPPEIVSADFVNTPVRAYDPRWSPDNYAAHHVLIVDPNGLPRDQLTIDYAKERKLHRVQPLSDVIDRAGRSPDYVYFDSYWGREGVGKSQLNATVHSTAASVSAESAFETQPSDPIIRLNVTFGGVNDRPNSWGMIVDASESFDPDGTPLRYYWSDAVLPMGANDQLGKFDSMQLANLTVKDRNQGSSKVVGGYLSYYVPSFRSIETAKDKPYYDPNDTVRFEVRSEHFMLSKNTYTDALSVDLTSESRSVEILDWQKHRHSSEFANGIVQNNTAWYAGNVSVRAGDLLSGSVKISVANSYAQQMSRRSRSLTGVNVTRPSEAIVLDVGVLSRSFLVEDPVFDMKRTKYPAERDGLLNAGYRVISARNSGWKYELERRVKLQDAQYRTDERRFRQPGYREVFLRNHPDWEAGPTETSTRRWTTTEQAWRSTKSGRGEFTGDTRRVVTDPAVYRTLRQYEHERRVERTGYRTVHRTKYIRTSRTVTRWHRKCFPWGGCMRYSTTETVTDRERVTFTQRERYTYHTTVTDTYWANGRRHQDDAYTGRSKTVLREPAEYGTEYRYRYPVEHAETTTWYSATYREQVSPARYEWQEYKTTPSRIVVETNTKDPDVRLGDRVPTTVWTLSKPVRYEETWTNGPVNGRTVLNSSALVEKTTRVPYVNTATGERGSVTRVEQYDVQLSGNTTVEEIKSAVTDNQTSRPAQ